MTTDQMARALEPLGVERLYLLPFDAEMAAMTDATPSSAGSRVTR